MDQQQLSIFLIECMACRSGSGRSPRGVVIIIILSADQPAPPRHDWAPGPGCMWAMEALTTARREAPTWAWGPGGRIVSDKD